MSFVSAKLFALRHERVMRFTGNSFINASVALPISVLVNAPTCR